MSWFRAAAPSRTGQWVQDVYEIDHGYGRTEMKELGTYHWEGPEPDTGRPQNPAETPEGLRRLQQIRNANTRSKVNANSRARTSQQERANKAEEDRVCREACDNAIADLRARRATFGGSRKTRKHQKKSRKNAKK